MTTNTHPMTRPEAILAALSNRAFCEASGRSLQALTGIARPEIYNVLGDMEYAGTIESYQRDSGEEVFFLPAPGPEYDACRSCYHAKHADNLYGERRLVGCSAPTCSLY
jgi:hypothetical protein